MSETKLAWAAIIDWPCKVLLESAPIVKETAKRVVLGGYTGLAFRCRTHLEPSEIVHTADEALAKLEHCTEAAIRGAEERAAELRGRLGLVRAKRAEIAKGGES